MATRSVRLFCLSFMCTSALLSACELRPKITAEARFRPDCPHDWEEYFVADSTLEPNFVTGGALPDSFLISGQITDVPEFHDCQRLILPPKDGDSEMESAMTYGKLGALFVRDSLDSRLGRPRVVVAEVVSEGTYPRLGIQEGFNCVLLEREPRRARMISLGVDATGPTCRDIDTLQVDTLTRLLATLRQYPLDITPSEPYGVADVPAVARWEWDPAKREQLIGAKCAPNRWCVFGPPGHVAANVAVGGAAPVQMRVHGWYDEQYIAEYLTDPALTPSRRVVPGKVFATVFPDPALRTYNDLSALANAWYPVAHIALPQDFPTYKSKLGLVRASVGTNDFGGLNHVALCYGSYLDCKVPSVALSGSAARCPVIVDKKSMWGMVVSPTGADTMYHCVQYRKHTVVGFDMPRVVRWRWRPDDETGWIWCPAGCCEVHPKV